MAGDAALSRPTNKINVETTLDTLDFCSPSTLLTSCKDRLKQQFKQQETHFLDNPEEADWLIHSRSNEMDQLLTELWQHFFPNHSQDMALIAVGGYGRGELLPFSDIDLLILAEDSALAKHKDQLGAFVTFLWDTGLDIGHSVRSIHTCIEEAKADISTATNLLESRFICGGESISESLFDIITSDDILTSQEFFQAKIKEQKDRHKKHRQTEYNLEPNVKNSPGGLRDVQTIGWITRRHFDDQQVEGIIRAGFLSEEDLDILNNGQAFLFKVRFALHIFANRKQDRLLFEFQKTIANALGYEDDDSSLGVEKLMKQYFRWVLALSELNEMLLQLFDETIVQEKSPDKPYRLNDRFVVTNGFLESARENLFIEEPSALLEVFLLLCRNDSIKHVKASTIREIRDNRHLIDEDFRQQAKNKNLFLKILQSERRVASVIDLMLRYGILGKFIPAFGDIVGQTQLDMFHIYSVDKHTMMVLKNMRRFTYTEEGDSTQNFPLARKVMSTIKDKEVLYLACLFHDIGKGRGGDHSVLGAEDAYEFCKYLGLSNRSSKLVSWLVKYHLYMSRTAQKRDLSDPDVIRQFALRVGDKRHLDCLFLLTVADINGTNPELWNSWRASLLRQLYHETNALFKLGLETIVDKQDIIQETQQAASAALEDIPNTELQAFWQGLGDDYFLRETVDDIIWHATTLINQQDTDKPLVFLRNAEEEDHLGATQLFIYAKDLPYTFAKVTAFLEQEALTVVGAQVYTSAQGFTLDTFLLLDAEGSKLQLLPEEIDRLTHGLTTLLAQPMAESQALRRTPRQLKFFPIPTQTHMRTNTDKGFHVLEVTTADRPGLLAIIGKLFMDYQVELVSAKITTLGERVEDIFYIQGIEQPLLTDQAATALQTQLREQLDQQVAKTSE